VSAVVEADPGVLGDERVQRAVEGRFLDSAISVREAAMELVGHHIVTRPDFAVKVLFSQDLSLPMNRISSRVATVETITLFQ
jgi:hypothetical protein